MMRQRLCLLALLAVTLASQASAQVTLRSDVPLWTSERGESDLFPKAFFDDDTFGCSNIIRTGLYGVTHADPEQAGEFWRLGNYGAIHCAMTFGRATDREEVADAFVDYAWLVRLGTIDRGDRTLDLMALQIGVRGGSEYVLLARPHEAPMDAPLELLDAACPRDAERQTAELDIWRTDYCVMEDQDALRRVARNAARKPPRARLERLGGETGE